MSDTQASTPSFYCADCSRQVGEQLFGTAPPVDVWLALEYTGAWGAKAVTQNNLPDPVLRYLHAELPGFKTRPLLIRQDDRHDGSPACFVAVADALQPRLYRFDLQAYNDLLAIDLAGVVAGDARYVPHLQDTPLYLVCTNGRRDRACAKYGQAFYRAMRDHAGAAVWQSTHLGGHRFAAAALFLPHGLAYGHLDPHDAAPLFDLHRQGRVDLAHLRGRTCYAKPVQAAEYYLRRALQIDTLPGVRLLNVVEEGPQRWVVRFAALDDGREHRLRLVLGETTAGVYLTSTDAELSRVPQYDLLGHDML